MATLYAALGGSSTTSALYTVNAGTGAMASVGATGFGLTALAVDPTTGTMYGVTNVNSGASPRSLVTVDKITGVGTLVGALGLAAGHNAADICFDAAGTLYGWDSFGGVFGLFPINKATGAAGASVGNPGANDLSGGLAFDSGGTLHHVNGNQRKVATVNTGTGTETFGATISGAPFSGFCQAGSFDGADVFYGVHGGGSLQHLVTYDLSTAVVTDIGVMVGTTDALAWDLFVAPATLTADFSATPLSGSAPLAVSFSDLSTGTPTGWLWDFGDGATSTAQNPVHVYMGAASFDVSLTVTN